MKFNLKVLITTGLAAAALIAAPAISQFTNARAFSPGVAEELNLTADQQAALDTLRENTHSQVSDILTSDQQASLQASIDAGTKPHRALHDLDLSESQRQELRSIRDASREASQDILTEEQQQQLRQTRAHHSRRGDQTKGGEGRGQIFEDLDLTADQQSQIETIRANGRSQVEAILTAEQRSSLQSSVDGEGGLRHALRSLDLSDDQRTEIRSVMESSRDAIGEVLTDDQKEQLQQAMQAHRGERRQR